MSKILKSSELIINADGSIFHLHLKPHEIADDIILVGDPKRVDIIASFFSEIKFKASNREFYSITGKYKGKLITALSTGIGTDNIDIVLNELDALANIDLASRTINSEHRSLRLVRIGTSGALQPELKAGSIVASRFAIGFDGLLNFYKKRDQICKLEIEKSFIEHTNWPKIFPAPYVAPANDELFNKFGKDYFHGITISANGFYAPQGRELRAELSYPQLFNDLPEFKYDGLSITNFEMECSALYGLSALLGHKAFTACLIIANRRLKEYLGDYTDLMSQLIEDILNKIANG